MHRHRKLLAALKTLKLPGDFVIVGSGALAAHGIRDCGDLDITLGPEAWAATVAFFKELKVDPQEDYLGGDSQYLTLWSQEVQEFVPHMHMELPVHYKIDGFDRVDVPIGDGTERFKVPWEQLWEESDLIDGFRYQSLPSVLKMKKGMTRPKDKLDAENLAKYLRFRALGINMPR